MADLYYGRIVLDDPYITFRYANNLVDHGQFVYNQGQWVLATTTPIYAFLMTIVDVVGLPVPATAVVLNLLCEIGILYVLGQLLKALGLQGWQLNLALIVVGVLTLTNRALSIASNSGMETPLFIALNLLALLHIMRHRYDLASIIGAFATLTRPDGILMLLIVLAVVVVRQERRLPVREMAIALLIGLPWIIVAQLTYGSFLPNFVLAKGAIVQIWGSTLGSKLSTLFYEPLRVFVLFSFPPLIWGILAARCKCPTGG